MRYLEAELYRFFSRRKTLFSRAIVFYRPVPIVVFTMPLTGDIRGLIFASTTLYSTFLGLVFSIYRLPGRLSRDLGGPALLELIYVKRREFLLGRLASTLAIAFVLELFPIMSILSAALPSIGLKYALSAPLLAFVSSAAALGSASLGLLFAYKRNPTFALSATYALTIASTAVPYILYALFHDPKRLLALMVSPGFSPAMLVYFALSRLGVTVKNEVRRLYASRAGKDPYYPDPAVSLLPSFLYLSLSVAIFRIRFRKADL